jgi:hypothetical protein
MTPTQLELQAAALKSSTASFDRPRRPAGRITFPRTPARRRKNLRPASPSADSLNREKARRASGKSGGSEWRDEKPTPRRAQFEKLYPAFAALALWVIS